MNHNIKEIQVYNINKPQRYVGRCFIHCSATDAAGRPFEGAELGKTIDRWHKARWRTGLGYHFLIDKQGKLIQGRSLAASPAAQRGHNVGTIAIMLHGLHKDKFTDEQIETLKEVCKHINDLYGGNITFHGHREVAAKACPVIDYKNILKLDNKGNLGI